MQGSIVWELSFGATLVVQSVDLWIHFPPRHGFTLSIDYYIALAQYIG